MVGGKPPNRLTPLSISILRAIGRGNHSIRNIRREVKSPTATIYDHLHLLESKNLVKKVGWGVYTLTSNGLKFLQHLRGSLEEDEVDAFLAELEREMVAEVEELL